MKLACLMNGGTRRTSPITRCAGRMTTALQHVPGLAAAAAACASLVLAPAYAQPVIPGAVGFGIDTPAGRGGVVYRVTNLNEGGSGSLGACIEARGPRVCVFEVSGTIRLTRDLVVHNAFLTIAGQTAPSPGINLRGAGMRIETNDVLVQHIRVRVGDDLIGPDPENRDGLTITGNATKWARNVVLDHCSFAWGVDETVTAWAYYDDITYLNSIFAEPLRESIHPNPGVPGSPGQGFGLLFGSNDGRASVIGNLLAHIVERNPASLTTEMVFVNNVVYNRANMDVDLQTLNGRVTRNAIVGNVFIRGADYTRTMKPVNVRTGDTKLGLVPGSRIYVKDNQSQETSGDPWSVVSFEGKPYPSRTAFEVSSAPARTWPLGLHPLPTANNKVYDHVLRNAGARPMDRDSVDLRVVQSVRSRTGRIINCVSPNGTTRCARNAGGWPTLPVNRRTLTLPADPNTIDASGYTNLEKWLHRMAAEVEGVPPPKYPGSPADFRIH